MFCGVHCPSVNGPVPIGFAMLSPTGSLRADQMCCGTMLTWSAIGKKYGTAELANVMTTLSVPDLVTLESTDHTD